MKRRPTILLGTLQGARASCAAPWSACGDASVPPQRPAPVAQAFVPHDALGAPVATGLAGSAGRNGR
jgi:hypothetical protein